MHEITAALIYPYGPLFTVFGLHFLAAGDLHVNYVFLHIIIVVHMLTSLKLPP